MAHSDSQHSQAATDGIGDTVLSISEQDLAQRSGEQRSLGGEKTLSGEYSSRSTRGQSAREQVDNVDVHLKASKSDDGVNLPSEGVTSQDFQKDYNEQLKKIINTYSEVNKLGKVSARTSSEGFDQHVGDLQDRSHRDGKSQQNSSSIAQEDIPLESNLHTVFSILVGKTEKIEQDAENKVTSTDSSDEIRHIDVEELKDTEETCDQHSTTDDPSHPHRNAKLGMFSSNNWKRIRNTLKAASEMQGTKKHKHALDREDSFLKKFSTRNHQDINNIPTVSDAEDQRLNESWSKYEGWFVIHHDGTFMFSWLGIMTLAVLYNVWTCIAREAFIEIQQGCPTCWYTLDGVFDLIYVCDILVQFRTGYLDQGLMVYDSRKLCHKYTHSYYIYIDFLCLLPLDLLQFLIGIHPMIRFPRFFKVYRTFGFLYMLESRTSFPNLFRVANLTHLVLLGAHWFAAFYYMISCAEDFKGGWAYPRPVGEFADITRKYLQSFFWAMMTLTTIGDLPHPSNSNQYVFVIASYLIGVFVFATIVGQVGNVINNRNASRIEFERLLDGAKVYMQTHNVPHNLQKRVQRWYDYVWSRGRLNGCDINSLGLLPDKLKTELAIHVNLETLRKVTIFQECQPEFLHDLVLKMKAYIFTPGDLICRRGEVAREMFIIADGVVEIISETGSVLKRMGAGDFFGEIGILNLDGGINRRSADVRSVGYLELFVLSREDVLEALKDHPEAEVVIRQYGQKRLREVEAHRQKMKPLQNEGSLEQPAHTPEAPPTVQNRLLKTLKNWNSGVRKQSTQVNKNQMSPPAGGTADVQRQPTYEEREYFTIDELSGNRGSPGLKFQQDASTSINRKESSSGRSHPMSIIQQLTSDINYQKLAADITAMQGMIDKRLTFLEDAFVSTSAQLDKLAASQDTLVHLLTQNVDVRQLPQPSVAGKGDDDQVIHRL